MTLKLRLAFLPLVLLMGAGCATKPAPYDYAAFREAKPATLLVMPPVNLSPDVKATPAVWSQATRPLAEAGYYVLPAKLVDETLKQNGVHTAAEAQDIPLSKLREVFGADAAVFLKVHSYGTSYHLIGSETRADVEAKVVDLRSGHLLWQGRAVASSAEQAQQTQGGLAVLLVTALVKQVANSATDAAYTYAGQANDRVFRLPRYNGILAGPRSPRYGQPLPEQ
jgi:hypothetical protein